MKDFQDGSLVETQFITIYVPIFREKLEKLKRRGQEDCTEAIQIRETLAAIDTACRKSCLRDDNRPLLTAAE